MRSQALLLIVAVLPHALAAGEGLTSHKDAATGSGSPAAEAGLLEVPVVLPEYATKEQDAYLCTAVQLPDRPLKLVGITPHSDQRIVHHMLLFGCKSPAKRAKVWDCAMASACSDGNEAVLYGWGKNAPAMRVPEGAGFSVGPGTAIRTVVLQMHYLDGRPMNDTSGLTLHLSPAEVPNSAGMVAFASGFTIPARTPEMLVENSCCYAGWEPLHGFATRVHTHMLGREVYLDRWLPGGRSKPERVAGVDPQKPQGFYPVQPQATFLPGDRLAMACRFNSSGVDHDVYAGNTHHDEMCNLYLMLYSQLPVFMWCLDSHEWVELNGAGGLPDGATLHPETQVFQPPAAIETGNKKGASFPVGQLSGVASVGDGTLWAFHRGNLAWTVDGVVTTGSSSDKSGLLQGPTVLQLDQDTGEVLRSWGAGTFALPHMLTLDWDGGVWVTDVALHQAIKFSANGQQLMALGMRMEPGDGPSNFCRPTQVAVSRSGSIFVADGYCNSRVAEFNASGGWVRDYRLPKKGTQMEVPHSVVVHECRKLLLVADRENGLVHAFQLGTAKLMGTWDLGKLGLPYALALGPYGTVLALTWANRDSKGAKSHLVVLGSRPGQLGSHWELPGVLVPHDLALAPAPLELTGAGERLLAVVVAETRESVGDNLHKFVLLPPDAQLATGSSASSGRSVELEDAEEQAEVAAGDAAQGHTAADAGDGDSSKPSGIQASHIGHVMLKPVDGDADGSSGAADEAEADLEEGLVMGQPTSGEHDAGATHVGHSMVKPVDLSAQHEQPEVSDKAAAAVEPFKEQLKSQDGKASAAGQHQAEATAAEQEQGAGLGSDEESQDGTAAAAAAAAGTDHTAVDEAVQEDEMAAAQQESELEAESQAAAAAAAQQKGGYAWHPVHEKQALGRAIAQPWILATVFVGVALVTWNGLLQLRRRNTHAYQPPGHVHSV